MLRRCLTLSTFSFHDVLHNNILSPFFFFNDTATTEIYTLSLHDALPIFQRGARPIPWIRSLIHPGTSTATRSEEHTSELQSHLNLVCRLLLEKKNSTTRTHQSCSSHVDHTSSPSISP